MTSLMDLWLALGVTADEQLAQLVAAYEAQKLSEDLFVQAAALTVLTANVRATTYADMAAATLAGGLVLGLTLPPDELARLNAAFTTITAGDPAEVPMRSSRVARSEPLHRGRTMYQEALRVRGVKRWKRIVQPDACEACASMAEEVHDMDLAFFDHKGCRCTLAPADPEDFAGWGDRQRATQHRLIKTYQAPQGQLRLSAGVRIR
jgi:hypothetical protein